MADIFKRSFKSIKLSLINYKKYTGFDNNKNIDVNYNHISRTVNLKGISPEVVEGYYNGKPVDFITHDWTSPPHPDILNSQYFLIYNDNGLQWVDLAFGGLEFDFMLISYVAYYDNFKFALREVHGFMSPEAHKQSHYNDGTYIISGVSLQDFTLGNTTLRYPDVPQFTINDEDIATDIKILNTKSYTRYSLSGALGEPNFNLNTTEIVNNLANRPYYNEFTGGVWQQTLMDSNQYMCIWLIAIPVTSDENSQHYRINFAQGQQQGSLVDIQNLTPADYNVGRFSSISPESVFFGKIIIRYISNNFSITQVDSITGARNNQVSSPSGNFLSVVSSDATLTGNGTTTSPLSVNNAPFAFDGITTTERDALTPLAGDIIYNTTSNKHQAFNGIIWNDLY